MAQLPSSDNIETDPSIAFTWQFNMLYESEFNQGRTKLPKSPTFSDLEEKYKFELSFDFHCQLELQSLNALDLNITCLVSVAFSNKPYTFRGKITCERLTAGHFKRLRPDTDKDIFCVPRPFFSPRHPPKEKVIINCVIIIHKKPNNLTNDLNKMFQDMKHSDVILCVKGKEFAAHKAILACRSPVFAAMFASPMEENRINKVTITDFSPETIQELLKFIYTGSVSSSKLNELAPGLLAAADKYSLEDLKSLAEEDMMSSLCVGNVCESFLHADLHNAAELKRKVMEFILVNSGKVMATKSWVDLQKINPKLCLDFYTYKWL